MADTTLPAIIARFHAVLQAAGSGSLKASKDQFSHDRTPNTLTDLAYWIEDTGLTSTRPMTSSREARIDSLTVFVARSMKFAPVTEIDTLHDLLVTIERQIKADGPSNGYHVDISGHRVSRPEGRDIAIGSVTFVCDYDFAEV